MRAALAVLLLTTAACGDGAVSSTTAASSSSTAAAFSCDADDLLATVAAQVDRYLPGRAVEPWLPTGQNAYVNRSPSPADYGSALEATCVGVWSRLTSAREFDQVHLAWNAAGDVAAVVQLSELPAQRLGSDVVFDGVFGFDLLSGVITGDGWFVGLHHRDEMVMIWARGWTYADLLVAWG